MPITMQTEGLGEIGETLRNLGEQAHAVAAKALYKGADVLADAYTNATKRIVAEPYHYLARPDLTGTKRYASLEEKAALMGKIGIARFRKDMDGIDTRIGFSAKTGYATVHGKKTPVIVIARSINSGTSFMHAQPVYRKAESSNRKAAKNAIIEQLESELEIIINGNNG